ncbi:MAG: hypothetical protein JWQ79_2793 [Mucilaginibacter sp.]|nr:hypothetical protein [Mucilaginibacter sp.]
MKAIKSTLLALLLILAATMVRAQTPSVNTSFNSMITAYIDLKNALVADDGADAQIKAKILNNKISGVPAEDMSVGQLGVWRGYADKLSFDSRHMSETNAIDHQREHFASLSKNMYAIIRAFNVNSTVIYWQYCPMKKSSWLSETATIKNPYYGKEMPDCGSTKATLKAVN